MLPNNNNKEDFFPGKRVFKQIQYCCELVSWSPNDYIFIGLYQYKFTILGWISLLKFGYIHFRFGKNLCQFFFPFILTYDLCVSQEILLDKCINLKLGWLGNLNIKLKKQKPLSMSIVHAMWLVYTPSVPLCLSSIPFWDVPKYCPVSKNKSH